MISVIICTYNRANLLKRALNSLARQSFKEFEIIIVDDGSEDNTCEICNSFKDQMSSLKYIYKKNTGLSNARNIGIKSSTGDYILFTDDDCIPEENWVERMSFYLKKETIVAGAVTSPVSNYLKLCHNIAQFHRFMPGRKAGYIEFISGGNMGFRISVLNEAGGFENNRKIAEDMEFILRARKKGNRIFFAPDASVLHNPPRTDLKDILKYASDHARETVILRNKYSSLLNTPFLLKSPYLILLFAPIISLKITGEIYIKNSYTRQFLWTLPLVYLLKIAWCYGAFHGLKESKAYES